MINAGTSSSAYGDMKILGCRFIDASTYGLNSQSSGYLTYTIKNNYFSNYSGSTAYRGMNFGNSSSNVCIDSCIGNKMKLNASSSNYGICIGQTLNYYGPLAGVYAYFANNEIIIDNGTINYGFNWQNMSYIKFYGNSIYINGKGGNAYGFYITNTNTGYPIYVKYNNFYINNPGGNAYSVYH